MSDDLLATSIGVFFRRTTSLKTDSPRVSKVFPMPRTYQMTILVSRYRWSRQPSITTRTFMSSTIIRFSSNKNPNSPLYAFLKLSSNSQPSSFEDSAIRAVSVPSNLIFKKLSVLTLLSVNPCLFRSALTFDVSSLIRLRRRDLESGDHVSEEGSWSSNALEIIP
jgi:hypothetical protein